MNIALYNFLKVILYQNSYKKKLFCSFSFNVNMILSLRNSSVRYSIMTYIIKLLFGLSIYTRRLS